jgi:regulatory protein
MARAKRIISKKEALVKAQNLCGHQEKCESDIRKKLFDWSANSEDFNSIILSLKEDQFIDEQRYASIYAKEKFKFSKWGKIKIAYSLKQKNISSNFIQNALGEILENEYDDVLENELIKKMKSIKETDEYTMKTKLVRYALSKGYENGKVFDKVSLILLKNKKS